MCRYWVLVYTRYHTSYSFEKSKTKEQIKKKKKNSNIELDFQIVFPIYWTSETISITNCVRPCDVLEFVLCWRFICYRMSTCRPHDAQQLPIRFFAIVSIITPHAQARAHTHTSDWMPFVYFIRSVSISCFHSSLLFFWFSCSFFASEFVSLIVAIINNIPLRVALDYLSANAALRLSFTFYETIRWQNHSHTQDPRETCYSNYLYVQHTRSISEFLIHLPQSCVLVYRRLWVIPVSLVCDVHWIFWS